MKNIESYNSSYPLAYYELGMIYSFYGKVSAKGTLATEEQIRKYAKVLNKLDVEEQGNAIKPVRGETIIPASRINRFYAVVVDKIRTGKQAHIIVMFCNKYNGQLEYYTRKYAVDFGCDTDGKDLMPVSAHLDFESKINGKVGGITLASKNDKVGGVTRVDGKKDSASSIGRITKVKTSNSKVVDNSNSKGKIGGITLVQEKKVGGITRIKK